MFNKVQGLALIVVLSIMTLAVGAIVLTSFQATNARCASSTAVYNTTQGICVLSTNHSAADGAINPAWNIVNNGELSVDNVSGQFPVAGTLIGIGVLLAAIGAAFTFFRSRA